MMRTQFHDRREAGDLLAHRLTEYIKHDVDGVDGDVTDKRRRGFDLIIGLPRGGVDVAFPIAMELATPLDILVVKKLGAPGQPELAIGAIASGGYAFVNYEICRRLGISQREVASIRYQATQELIDREKDLLKDRKHLPWTTKRILIVDDGIATGATIEVAIRAISAQLPASLSIAVPVASLSVIERLHRRVDQIFTLQSPSVLGAVAEFYQEFPQVSDEEVREMMDRIDRAHLANGERVEHPGERKKYGLAARR